MKCILLEKKNRVFSFYFIVLTSVFFIFSFRRSAFAQEIKEAFESLRKFQSWQVEFYEEIVEKGSVIERREGKIYFEKPLKFKISYQDGNEVLSDGTFIYFVRKDKNKVYVRELKDEVSENLIVEILRGSDRVFDFFFVKKIDEGEYELYPKKDVIKNVSRVIVYLNPIVFPIKKVEIWRGTLGVKLEIKNVSFKKESMRFSFEGLNIIREPK
ncbi:MAG: outer membrane lipoprotein carrier protein LolA [Candidatus Calescibacterium sp.]|nr:outer membrane lipoprotein carrier protein LolA [Candidatus Calescibacterium sp.]